MTTPESSPRNAAQRVLDYHATKTTALTAYEEDVSIMARALVEIDPEVIGACALFMQVTGGMKDYGGVITKLRRYAALLDGTAATQEPT